MRALDRLLFYKVAPRQIRYLKPPDYSRTTGLARAVIDQMARDFVVGPPMTIHLSNPELMAGVWAMGRECLAAGREGRETRERIAAVVSRLNQCPYCLDIHKAMLHAFGSEELLEDTEIPRQPNLLGTAICFHYLNRMVNVFLDPAPFMTHSPRMIRLSGRLLRPLVTAQVVKPGDFLTAGGASLPPEFSWASPDANVAGGLSRFAAAAEAAGQESVEPEVRALLLEEVSKWRGETPPLGFASGVKPAARLALVTALASYRVDEKLVNDFRRERPSDRDLINLTAWSSYTAAKRIASWLSTDRL